MIRLFVIVEGDTEQEFVKRSLAPHLNALEVWTNPIEVTTKRDRKTGEKLSQGGGHWKHWRKDICNVLRSKAADLRVTSMFDLYGLPDDFPQLSEHSTERNTIRRACMLESAMSADINDHEFEALVLSGLEHLREQFVDADARAGVDELRQELGDTAPEDVNDGPNTAPSRRLLARVPWLWQEYPWPTRDRQSRDRRAQKALPAFRRVGPVARSARKTAMTGNSA